MDLSNDDDETSSLLDLPGVEEIGKVRSEETKQSSESILEKHSVKPSGSGLTFFLGDEDEDDDDDDDDEEEFREFEALRPDSLVISMFEASRHWHCLDALDHIATYFFITASEIRITNY